MTRALFFAALCGLCLVGVAMADPLPGERIKFDQQPMIITLVGDGTGLQVPYYGHDEASEADAIGIINGHTQYIGQSWMADDFADKLNAPVVHLKWWGSYIGQQPEPIGYAKKFLIEFLTDVPGGAAPSRPGSIIQSEVVRLGALGPQSGTFIETLVRPPDPVLGEALYQYNAELKLPFPELADHVYWLKIVHLDDTPDVQLQVGLAQPRLHDPGPAGFDPAGGDTRRVPGRPASGRPADLAFPGRRGQRRPDSTLG